MKRFSFTIIEKFVIAVFIVVSTVFVYSVVSGDKTVCNRLTAQATQIAHTALRYIISPTPTMPPRIAQNKNGYQTIVPGQIDITQIPQKNPTYDDWGQAKKIDDHTYTIRVGYDDRMGTAQEILTALNSYRQASGRGPLAWDDRLASYSQERANNFQSIETTDKHAGFDDYLENQDGFNKLGYSRLGENSYYGGPLYGVHLIEWVFAKSPGHDANQLDPGWTHVGIGVTNNATNLIFGAGRL